MSHRVRPRMRLNRSQGVIVSMSRNPGRPRSADSIIHDSSCSWSQSGHTGPRNLHTCAQYVSSSRTADCASMHVLDKDCTSKCTKMLL